MKDYDESLEQFSVRVRNCMHAADIFSIDDLRLYLAKGGTLRDIQGIGLGSLNQIIKALATWEPGHAAPTVAAKARILNGIDLDDNYAVFRAVEPPGFDHWFNIHFPRQDQMLNEDDTEPSKEELEAATAEYWRFRKMALLGWIASGQGWG